MKKGNSHELSGIRKILVIKLRHIGDVLLTAPVFRVLKEYFPDAHVAALVNRGTEEVLTGNSFIDEIIAFKGDIRGLSGMKRIKEEIRFLRQTRGKSFDLTIDLTGGDRSAVLSYVSGAGCRLARDPMRQGMTGKRFLYTRLVRPDEGYHTVLQNLEIVRSIGVKADNLRVDFHIPDEAGRTIRSTLSRHGITEKDTVVHIHPTSRWLFKCWKDEYMAEVIRRMTGNGLKVIVTSSPSEREIRKTRHILSMVGKDAALLDLCGSTSIKELAAVSAASDLFFGVDSAPMHIAAAVGTPAVALFGPSSAVLWGPWDNDNSFKNPYSMKNGRQESGIHTVLQKDWECVPCHMDGCNGSKASKCLEDIPPSEVVDILFRRLKV